MPKVDNFKIQPHELRKKIKIQRSKQSKDDDNIPGTSEWTLLKETRAKVKTDKIDEETMMQGQEDVIIRTFTIRAQKGVTITSKDRIIYNNEIYNIKSVEDIQEKGIWIIIKAEYEGLNTANEH